MDLSSARTFLERVLPWPPLGEPGAYVNIHYASKAVSTHTGKPFFNGSAAETLDEAVDAVRYAATNAKNSGDVWVCMSTQRMCNVKQINDTFSIKVAVRGQKSAVQLKSLFLDIDCKDGTYATQRDALVALTEFVRASGLPGPSVVVSSGNGLHVYWTITRPVTLAEWQPLSDALAEATRQLGLACDTQCTVDGARVLRVPGTGNHKTVPPRPVSLISASGPDYDVAVLREQLAPYAVRSNLVTLPARVDGDGVGANDELGSGIERRESRPVVLDTVAPSCGFIRDAITFGGKDYGQPLWNLTTLIATFAEDGRTQAHRMASGHPDYDEESTDALFDRKTRERDEKGLGWPACSSIQNAGCTSCASCPMLSAGKSPLHLAKSSTLPFGAQEEDLPRGFIRDNKGRIHQMVEGKDGATDQRLVCMYPIRDAWVQSEPWTLHFSTDISPTRRDVHISIQQRQLAGRDGMVVLAEQGLAVPSNHVPLLKDFLMSFIQHLQSVKDAIVSAAPFGWVVGGGTEGFAYGGRVWTANGDKAAAAPDGVIFRQYTPKGNLEPWLEASDFITQQQRPALDAILAMAFAAPLVRFCGENGLVLSAFSQESGIGKSTAIKVAQAVWGHPKKGVAGLDDTANSVVNKLGALKSLPVFWDELKSTEQTEKFVSFMFRVERGSEKSRLTSDARQRESGDWETMLMVASNASLVDFTTRSLRNTTAGLMRVFEYTVPPMTGAPNPDAPFITSRLSENFGHAGLTYAQWLGKNMHQVHKEVEGKVKEVKRNLRAGTDERFWACTVAVLLQGAQYANDLGLTTININEMYKFLVQAYDNMRGVKADSPSNMRDALSISTVLGQYLNSTHARNTLVTNKVKCGRGKPVKDEIQVVQGFERLDGLFVQRGNEDKVLRISQHHFREWLSDQGYSPYIVINELKKQWGAKDVNGMLGAGTPFSGLKERLLEIECAGSEIVEFVDGSA